MTIQHLYFLRHAEGLHNARLPHGPVADIPLTEEGFATVATIAEKIAAANFIHAPDAIRVSPLLRTVQTAAGLKPLYPHIEFELDAALIEWAHFDIPAGMVMTYAEKKPLIDELWERADPDWIGNDLGESFSACVARTKQATHTLFNDPRDSIICVSHAYFMQIFILNLLDQMDTTAEAMELSRSFERSSNLDIVHVARNRETGAVAIAHHKFSEGYQKAHAYPIRKSLTLAGDVQLMNK